MSALRPVYSYNLTIGTASNQGARVAPVGCRAVRLATTADCYVAIGPSPTATVANGMLIRASTVGEPFLIAAGDQIAVIANAAGGTLNVTEMSH